jgi:hypothetical protein
MLDLPVGIPDEGDFSFGQVPITRTDELYILGNPQMTLTNAKAVA